MSEILGSSKSFFICFNLVTFFSTRDRLKGLILRTLTFLKKSSDFSPVCIYNEVKMEKTGMVFTLKKKKKKKKKKKRKTSKFADAASNYCNER